jgi:hypothetical protein
VNVVCAGYIARYPLGGQTLHHLQYLVGLRRLGHRVTFVETWAGLTPVTTPRAGVMTADPAFGVAYLRGALAPHGLGDDWCYLAEDGRALRLDRAALARRCRGRRASIGRSRRTWWIPSAGGEKPWINLDTK